MGTPRRKLRCALRIGSLRAVEVQGLRLEHPVGVVRRLRGFQSALATAFTETLQERTPDLLGD